MTAARFAVFTAIFVIAAPILPAQNSPAFEVASIKPDDSVAVPGRGRISEIACTKGRFTARGLSAWYLIKWAWNIGADNDRLAGYPDWALHGGEYTIEAKASAPVSEDQCRLMLRTLLADRFRLRAHEEKRQVDAFDLVIAKSGLKIKRITDPDAPVNGPGFTIGGGKMQMFNPQLKGWTMEQLASALGYPVTGLGRKVFDKTGLEGIYRIDLNFRSSDDPGGAGPDVTTALREQLGLELKTAKEPLDVVVVDHIERPTSN